MTPLSATLRTWLDRGEPAALITVAETRGSTPRETGARMLVGMTRAVGTIGGGRLEWEAIAQARALIESGEGGGVLDLALGPAIGQCCGGHVALRLERAERDTLARLEALERGETAGFPRVYLFGAGHVGKALATALAPLPLRVTWVDERAHEFPAAIPAGVEPLVTDSPLDVVSAAPPGAAWLVLTHSHALDFEITEAVLRRGDFAYAGLIGSATKRRRFERTFSARGGDVRTLSRLTCPIGSALHRDKRPAVIAALVAAELLITIDEVLADIEDKVASARNWEA